MNRASAVAIGEAFQAAVASAVKQWLNDNAAMVLTAIRTGMEEAETEGRLEPEPKNAGADGTTYLTPAQAASRFGKMGKS